MVVDLLSWRLDVDVEATRTVARTLPFMTAPCDCGPCRNFQAALEFLPGPVRDLLDRLGTGPDKPAEIYHCCRNPDGTHKYGAWYHVVGTVLHGPDHSPEGQVPFEALSDQVLLFFTSKHVALVPEGFPTRVIQVEFIIDMPWVLDEDPPQ